MQGPVDLKHRKVRQCSQAACISEAVGASLGDPEDHIAFERLLGRRHGDKSGGRAARYGGLDFCAGDDCERRRCTIKADATSAGEIVSQDNDGCSYLAGGGLHFDEGAKAHSEAEDSTFVGGSAACRCAIERPVCALS